MDPSNNKVIYAATYQRRRATWGFNGGGPGSAMWKSSDAGRTWTKLTQGVPTGPLGRIGMDVYRANPNIVYARIEHAKESGTYRSDDAGQTWRKMSDTNPRPMYFSQIRIDPTIDARIYVLGVQISHLGRWRQDVHRARRRCIRRSPRDVDQPEQSRTTSSTAPTAASASATTAARPGKASTTWTSGSSTTSPTTWRRPTTSTAACRTTTRGAARARCAAAQGIANDDWFSVQGGDGFDVQVDPKDPRTIYAESQDGNISRIDRVTNERKSIRPLPAKGEAPYRWNWNTPILISPHDNNTIYVGGNKVFKSTDRGNSWTAISGDLTESDRSRNAVADGRQGGGVRDRQARRRAVVRQHRVAGRIAEAGRRDLRRHRRRQGPHDAGRRQDLDRHHRPVPERAEERVRVAARALGARSQRRLRELRQPSRRRHEHLRLRQRRRRQQLPLDRRGHSRRATPSRR